MAYHTLREIPEDLQRAWKVAAALKSLTMDNYCFIALKQQITKDLSTTNVGAKVGGKSHV